MQKNGLTGAVLIGLALAACAQTDNAAPAGEEAAERPEQAPAIASSEDLMRLSCADFLAAAEVARTQPADAAALAAQDEIANGLTWLHGYLYAARKGEVPVLSQDWMAETAAEVYRDCSQAKDPQAVGLLEIATS